MQRTAVNVRPVSAKVSDRGTLKLERRASEREPAARTMAATYTNGRDRFGLTHLELLDRSETGLGALTRSALEPGMHVTICPEGSSIPWAGAVCVRCEPAGDLYRVGLAFTRRRAA